MSTQWPVAMVASLGITLCAHGGFEPWIEFENQTTIRVVADPALGVDDSEEKDFAFGDVDNDGDVDLVVVRKQGWSTTGRRPNVLFLNEGTGDGRSIDGVLVDRTAEFASAATIGSGFLDSTNDRDVALVDVDNDGWRDIVTATTLSEGLPTHISHPRVYINLGNDAEGNWQGFRYEAERIPQLHPTAAPRFNAVAAGDVTGDGYADLYFVNSDGGGQPVVDLDDRLLINDGSGYFADESSERMTTQMLDSSFGTAGAIADLNGDGFPDVVKATTGFAPVSVSVAYNAGGGIFLQQQAIYNHAPTHVSVGDLNADGLLDLVITDDGIDRYLLNLGNGPDGLADFNQHAFDSDTSGFGGNSLITDIDLDGCVDVLFADVDFEIPGCSWQTTLHRSECGSPDPVFRSDTGTLVEDDLTGVHDLAVFDLDGDGLQDLVLGRCSGMRVHIGIGAVLNIGYPQERPRVVEPDSTTTFPVTMAPAGQTTIVPGSETLVYSVDGAPSQAVPLQPLGNDEYEAALPPVSCGAAIDYYVRADLTAGGTPTDPPGAPVSFYTALSANDVATTLDEPVEGDVSAWTVQNDGTLVSGGWEQAVPNGTVFGIVQAAPAGDATETGTRAFVTENGLPGAGATDNDVDGGPTVLISPVLSVEGFDGFLSYSRWMFSEDQGTPDGDALEVEISDDGGASWLPLEIVERTESVWERTEFRLGAVVDDPTGPIRVRFSVMDLPNNSVTEAGIDDLLLESVSCDESVCSTDRNGDGTTDVDDLVTVIITWGTDNTDGDVTGDGFVDVDDLIAVITGWGPCP